jgi:two-component system NtrC family response regulator
LKIAAEKLRQLKPDVVLLDLRFPPNHQPEEGLAFLKNIKNFDYTIKVIVVTGAKDINVAYQSLELGAYDFVRKDTDAHMELPFRVNQTYERLQLERNIQEFRRLEVERIGGYSYGDGKIIIGTSENMMAVYNMIDKVAPTNATVLIYGETGTGKELVAAAIFAKSRRLKQKYIRRSILEIPREGNLLELELFGRVANYPNRGDVALPGLFEKAHKGTLFLDEIVGVPPEVQQRLLRTLREKVVVRMGDKKEQEIPVDFRLIVAMNKDLEKEVQAGRFREDLFYRLKEVEISIPPLRERIIDISHLAKYFIHKYHENNPSILGITEDGISFLQNYSWPGNVAELESAIKRVMIQANGDYITAEDFKMGGGDADGKDTLPNRLAAYETQLILDALSQSKWNQSRAAQFFGISEGTLRYRMKVLGIKKEKERRFLIRRSSRMNS